MTTFDATAIPANLANRHPSLAGGLERRGLDYSCGGDRTLVEGCRPLRVDEGETARELSEELTPEPEGDWVGMGPTELVDHIEATHHRYLHEELPRLGALADKVEAVHGANHTGLRDVVDTFRALRADLEPHLMKEERILFPMVRDLTAATDLPAFHCGSIANPISVMILEHHGAGRLLDQLVDLTGGFQPPADGCASFNAFYRGLAELNTDTRMHIHKENNSLFPAVSRIEKDLLAVGAGPEFEATGPDEPLSDSVAPR